MMKLFKYGLVFFFFIFPYLLYSQPDKLLKNFLTVDNGLSHNEVTSIVQDNDGFIWIGTRGGLNRYDGYDFKIFNQVPGESNSLVNPSVESLFVDSKGNIWIGTKSGGVSKFIPDEGKFENIVADYRHQNNLLVENRIISFFEDDEGKIWMGTWSNGFIIYDEQAATSKKYLPNQAITCFAQTQDKRIWVGTATRGLLEYIKETDTLIPRTGNTGGVQKIKEDRKRNVLWIAGSGLVKYDLRNGKFTNYEQSTYSMLLDRNGDIWLGSWGSGLSYFSPEAESFQKVSLYPETFISQNKDYDAILDIFQDKDGNIWMGTNGGGVCLLTPKLGFRSVGYNPEPNKGLVNTRVMSVVDDDHGNLWIGTIGSGLIWSPDRENYYPVPCEKNTRPDFLVIKDIYQDNEFRIWVGTNTGTTYILDFSDKLPELIPAQEVYDGFPSFGQGVSFLDLGNEFWYGTLDNGLLVLDKNDNYKVKRSYTKDDPATGNLNSNRISAQLKDSKERIWLGTYNGLHVFNRADSTIQVASNHYAFEGAFTGNIITSMVEDQFGNIWIGTPNGLNQLTETSEGAFKVNYFTEEDELASNFIKGISYDLNGNIWVSTSSSISMYDVQNETFVNFKESDGIRGKNFTEASVFRNRKGELFFGGDEGLTYFQPEEIQPELICNKPIFTDLKILGEHVNINERLGASIILKESVTHAPEIEIPYRLNDFEVQFSALDYKSMGGNGYKYMLDDLDKNWKYLGTRRFVNFNNLHPGEYTLKIKSANSHNVWNEEAAVLSIKVLPPFWMAWYAKVFYILLVLGIVSVIRWNAIRQVRLTNSLEMEKVLHAQDQKMSEMKFQFFTNISHEFRTPLTLILAPLKELLKKRETYQLNDEVTSKIVLIQNNAQRLMKLVNQLLDFRKLESGKMVLSASLTNIEDFVSEICFSFEELAKINAIDFTFHSALAEKRIWCDRDKLEIVLNNLISNAFKYVADSGVVEVSLYEEEEELLISVSDNGPGIKSTEIKHIFDRFYRTGHDEKNGSTGIGLDLAKRYIELHHGSITVSSEPNVNTEFVVALPKGSEHLKPEEKVGSKPETGKSFLSESKLGNILPTFNKAVSKSDECVLIVEDDPDVNRYLVNLLETHYCIESASNGKEGYEKVLTLNPDLIISDLVMPDMDGYEFCRKIKANENTALIPFIFLTAKNDEQFRLQAIQTGADDVISKPFDPDLLMGKVKNILSNRKKLQKEFSKSIRLEPSDIEITSGDELFIENVISIIENNLQNHQFSSDYLASEMNMSSSSLYRRLKNLTGSSTAEFIRSIRIKRAAQLLADKQKPIAEIAFEVGFNDVKHFRTVFNKQFNCSPSRYRDKL